MALATPSGLFNKFTTANNISTGNVKYVGGLRWPSTPLETAATRSHYLGILDQLYSNQWNLPQCKSDKSVSNFNSFRYVVNRIFCV